MKKQDNAIIGIYKITNPKGKVYIGQSVDITLRFKYYKRLSCKQQIKLFNSLKKYGPENHKFEIIEECLLEQLNEKEIYWILFYDSTNKGLNLREGGTQGKLSQETKNKISNSLKNKPKTKEHSIKISKSKKGCVYSKERGLKISQKLKGRELFNLQVAVLQYDLQGNFIMKHDSMTKAAQFLNLKHCNGIEACCRGIQKTSAGFKWKRYEEKENT